MSDTIDPIHELKVRAELLHKSVARGDAGALARLRALHELRRAPPEALAAFASSAQRKHCLAVVAHEVGFRSWEHASRVLGGESDADLGEILYPKGVGAILNQWFATYDEARAAHAEQGGYLLAYKRQFFLASREFIAITLGLYPDDPDWTLLAFDWLRAGDPKAKEARRRLYGKLLAKQRAAA